jgi:hypothetical protein
MAQTKTQSPTKIQKKNKQEHTDDKLEFNYYSEFIYDDFSIGHSTKKKVDGHNFQSVSKERKKKIRIQHEEEVKQASKTQKVVQKILATQLPLNNMSEEEKIAAVEKVYQIKPTANEMRLFTKERRHARQTKAVKYDSHEY